MRDILLRSALVFAPILVLCASGAMAQEAICGGISAVGDWVGGAEEASDVTGAEAPFEADGSVPIAGHLVRMFSLSEETDIRIDVGAVPAGDPYLALYGADGAEVAADDDSGGDYASRIETTLPAGTYCLAARSYEPGVTEVAVRIGRADQDWPEASVAPEVAEPHPGAGCFAEGTASLGTDLDAAALAEGREATASAAEVPAYGFALSEPSGISATARSEGGDPLIRVIDRDGTVLGENDDFDELDSRIDITAPLEPGEYCVEVEDLDGGDAPITVSLGGFDAAADRLRRLNAAELAPTGADDDAVEITDLGTLDGSLLHDARVGGEARWFRFDMPEGGLLVTEAIGNGADTSIVLFDRVGRRIGENDDGPQGLDSFLATRLLPGGYLLAVRVLDESAGDVRLLLERYVAAE